MVRRCYLTGNGGGAFDNTSGTIEAQNGSTVRLVSGAAITGGTLTTSGTGVITTPSGGAVQETATLNGVTISSGSQFVGADNSATTLVGTITNSGTLALASTGQAADFVYQRRRDPDRQWRACRSATALATASAAAPAVG